jgi:3-oxoacyl-[acyl-carrier protein] reductase
MHTAQTVVITGASSGIGLALTNAFVARGARVVANSRHVSTAGTLTPSPTLALVDGDIALPDVAARVAEAADRFGSLDLLVNNAGITKDGLLVRMKDADWDEVLGVNLRAAFQATRAAARLMVRQRSGRIVNVTSAAGAMGTAGQANYSAAKAGLIGLSKSTARELAHWGILVNAVAPGLIETDMAAVLPEKVRATYIEQVPLKRLGTSREVAEVVRFLASEGAGYITGQVIHVNGGLYM